MSAVLQTDLGEILSEIHFAMLEARPDWLAPVPLVDLEPELRALLFTDGTVTRTLEALALTPVSLRLLGQTQTTLPPTLSEAVQLEPRAPVTRRRVLICTGATGERGPAAALPVVWAESFLITERLPDRFASRLTDSPHGIGQAMTRRGLETRRELLWYGIGSCPAWVERGILGQHQLVRTYRVITSGASAMLISEGFALVRDGGVYRLRLLNQRGAGTSRSSAAAHR